jgi:hypothetical protein
MLFAFLTAMALSGGGCSGINTGASVSPLDFLMPGVGHFIKADPAPPGLSPTNVPVLFPETSTELATVK